MAQPRFYETQPATALAEIAAQAGAELADPATGSRLIAALASLDEAGPRDIAFFDNPRYAAQLAATEAGAVIVHARFANSVPAGTAIVLAKKPFHAFVALARQRQAAALRPRSDYGIQGIAVSAVIHATARIEDGATVDPLAVIGPNAEIGSDTLVGAGAVIGPGVKIGRGCNVGARTVVQFALIGNNVLIHPGCSIGQDGFGFVFGAERHVKVPQTGRVIIQNDVEIGANTTIDRGSLRDTVIGEGTKIDNQVQIGHNVTIGRHCVIAAKCGLAGSLTIGDNVALGAMVGLNNHITVGDGAAITAMSAVKDSVPPGGRWGGMFAKPTKQWFREIVAVERLAQQLAPGDGGGKSSGEKGGDGE